MRFNKLVLLTIFGSFPTFFAFGEVSRQSVQTAQGDFALVSGAKIESCQKEKSGVGCTDSAIFSSYTIYARPTNSSEFQFYSCTSNESFAAKLSEVREGKGSIPLVDTNCKFLQNGKALSATQFAKWSETLSTEARGLSNVAGLAYYALVGDYVENYVDASRVAPDARIFFANVGAEILNVLRNNGSSGPVFNPGIYDWNSKAVDYLVYRATK